MVPVNIDKASTGTLCHELVHHYCHPQFADACSVETKEGVTEYLTREVHGSKDREGLSPMYDSWTADINAMITRGAIDHEPICNAYFGAAPEAINALNSSKSALGRGH